MITLPFLIQTRCGDTWRTLDAYATWEDAEQAFLDDVRYPVEREYRIVGWVVVAWSAC